MISNSSLSPCGGEGRVRGSLHQRGFCSDTQSQPRAMSSHQHKRTHPLTPALSPSGGEGEE